MTANRYGSWKILAGASLFGLTACLSAELGDQRSASLSICGSDKKSALLVVTGSNTDPEQFAKYGEALSNSGLYDRYEGYYVAIGDPSNVLEGEWSDPEFLVLARFPCQAAVEAFWNSEEYTEIKALRENAGPVRATVFSELDPPERIIWDD